MRTREEIEKALNHLRDCFRAAEYMGDGTQMKALSCGIMALRWACGENPPGGFGDLLKELNAVDEERERHERN
jgi:hypothetical protein